MPPKCKFTKEEIVHTALDMARLEGPDAITARALGVKLNCSSKPIFSVFDNMEQLLQEVAVAARRLYSGYIDAGLREVKIPAFKAVGMQYIAFSLKEPQLFQMLFMCEQPARPSVADVLPIIDDNYQQILLSVEKCYQLDRADAERLYRHLWIYTHGIAVLCATNMCTFTPEKIGEMLTEVCTSIIKEIGRGRHHD